MEKCNISLEVSPKVEFYEKQLAAFRDVIDICNLSIGFMMKKFILHGEKTFSLEFLQELFIRDLGNAYDLWVNDPEHIVDGCLEEVAFSRIQEESLKVLEWGVYDEEQSKKEINSRLFMYWSIIEGLLQLPPDHCFMYSVTNHAYKLIDGAIVEFCFIVISGNEGLVLSGSVDS